MGGEEEKDHGRVVQSEVEVIPSKQGHRKSKDRTEDHD